MNAWTDPTEHTDSSGAGQRMVSDACPIADHDERLSGDIPDLLLASCGMVRPRLGVAFDRASLDPSRDVGGGTRP